MDKSTITAQKILTPHSLASKLAYWRFKQYKIVFTNGCFDILHIGHLETLQKAADLGDILLVGINTDASIKRLKGKKRPIMTENHRALLLSAFYFVHHVLLFEEDTPLNLIKTIQPDVLVKGGDYQKHEIVGADIVEQKGGQVITIPLVPNISTTNILNQ